MGGHVRRDVPAQLDTLRARIPDVAWTLHPRARARRRTSSPRWPTPPSTSPAWASPPATARWTGSAHESAPVPFRAGGRAPQPEPDRDREGAVHVPAGHLQGHPRTRGGTGHRPVRAPRQAPAPRHRARPGGAQGHRRDPARGRQPQAHRRGVFEAGRRHAVDRRHAHAGALRTARARRAAAPALPQGAGEPAPGLARPGRADAAGRHRRHRPGHRGAVRARRPGLAALLRMGARDRDARRRIRWPRSRRSRWSSSPTRR